MAKKSEKTPQIEDIKPVKLPDVVTAMRRYRNNQDWVDYYIKQIEAGCEDIKRGMGCDSAALIGAGGARVFDNIQYLKELLKKF